jgi:hypothetical protein
MPENAIVSTNPCAWIWSWARGGFLPWRTWQRGRNSLQFDGDADVEFADFESDNNTGSGAIIANFHIASESGNEVDIAQVAQLATTSETEHDQKITNELVSSIKEQYETWGSGIKTPFCGPSAKQLKANEQQMWASNANLKPNMTKGPHQKVQIGHCPTAVLKVNGVNAFVYFDSGSELDTILPDFARAIGIKPMAKDASIKIRLATKGSTSTTSYEVEVNIDLGEATLEHPLEVLNFDCWDIILGSYFCDCYNVCIDYKKKVVHIGDITIKTLSKDEEASTSRNHGAQKSSMEPKVTAITADDWLDGPLDKELPFLAEWCGDKSLSKTLLFHPKGKYAEHQWKKYPLLIFRNSYPLR